MSLVLNNWVQNSRLSHSSASKLHKYRQTVTNDYRITLHVSKYFIHKKTISSYSTGDNHVTCVQLSKPTIALLVAKRKVSDRCFWPIFCILCELDH